MFGALCLVVIVRRKQRAHHTKICGLVHTITNLPQVHKVMGSPLRGLVKAVLNNKAQSAPNETIGASFTLGTHVTRDALLGFKIH